MAERSSRSSSLCVRGDNVPNYRARSRRRRRYEAVLTLRGTDDWRADRLPDSPAKIAFCPAQGEVRIAVLPGHRYSTNRTGVNGALFEDLTGIPAVGRNSELVARRNAEGTFSATERIEIRPQDTLNKSGTEYRRRCDESPLGRLRTSGCAVAGTHLVRCWPAEPASRTVSCEVPLLIRVKQEERARLTDLD